MKPQQARRFWGERYLWMAISVVLLVLAFVLGFQYLQSDKSLRQVQRENRVLKAKLKTLKGDLSRGAWEAEGSKEEGLSIPVEDLAADLMQHPELIPYKGIMGGKMGFYSKKDIHVLTSRWVLAFFEDGHISGQMLLEYTVSPEGRIYWRVLSSYLD